MENTVFSSIEDVDDVNTLDEYQVALKAGLSPAEALKTVSIFSRDNARTPMQWNSEENGGFTKGRPWIKVNPNYQRINVKAQEEDENSVLSFYKKLISLRKNPEYKETIVYGTFVPFMEKEKNLIGFLRKGEKTLLILGNLQKDPRKVKTGGRIEKVLLNNLQALQAEEEAVCLEGYQFIIAEIK